MRCESHAGKPWTGRTLALSRHSGNKGGNNFAQGKKMPKPQSWRGNGFVRKSQGQSFHCDVQCVVCLTFFRFRGPAELLHVAF